MAVSVVHLGESPQPTRQDLQSHDGFLFVTGTYWDSWGSPLQAFLEASTPLEGDACWFGKPCGVIVTMHSVGGKEISNRLQGVLNSFGLFIPPMSSMVFSLVGQAAQESLHAKNSDFIDDVWSLEDLQVVATNLEVASNYSAKSNFTAWPVDRADPKRIWLMDVSR